MFNFVFNTEIPRIIFYNLQKNNYKVQSFSPQCLRPLYACNGLDVTTVEALGNRLRGYHPLQKRIYESSGTQCGYCTSGMLMNMHGLMSSGQPLTMQTIERGFSGQICRCTGYRPILDAFKSFATDAPAELVNKCRVI